ncbi:MAG: dihydroneopterin aldolase [Bacteroidales bacterium]|nr:dihydroneopterin aldolase [Bacteroidales bacterium]
MEKQLTTIAVEGMDFYAYHGCFKEETLIGTNFKVDIYLSVDTSLAESQDDMAGTVNYVEVYERVKRQVMIPSKLIEHVAARIRDAVMADFPQVCRVKVKVAKLNPPIGEKIREVNVTLEAAR